MGKIDTVTKEYMKDTKVFADLFNYTIYGGRQVIDPDKLHELDTTALVLPFGEDGAFVPVQKFRDELKCLSAKEDETAAYLVLGAELESKINYAMPVKNMLYDAMQYSGQVTQAAKSHRNMRKAKRIQKRTNSAVEKAMEEAAAAREQKVTSSEFLSGFQKKDRLIPVITLVVHFGEERWDGPLSLHGMLSVQNPGILSFIPDYRINLVSPYSLSDEEINKFHTSLREILLYIKYSKNKKKLNTLVAADERFRTLDWIAAEVINVTTNSELVMEKREEKIDMCQAIREMRQDAIDDTRVDDIRSIMEAFRVSADRAMQVLKIPEEQFAKYLSRLGNQATAE